MTEIKIKPFYIISFSSVLLYKYILKFPLFRYRLCVRCFIPNYTSRVYIIQMTFLPSDTHTAHRANSQDRNLFIY